MPTREEMHSLAQEITGSYEARTAGVAQIRRATQAQLREFAQNDAQRRSDMAAQLTGYDEAHAAIAQQQRADLAQIAPALRQTEAQRERETQQEIAQRKSDVSAQLKGYDQAHATMSQQLRADLAQGRADLRTSVSAQMQELHQGHTGLRTSVSAQLKGYDEAHQTMSRQQRADLAKGRADLRTSVSAQMQELATEQAGARAAWQELTATMQAKRAGATAVAEAPATVPAQKAPAKETQEEELGNGDLIDQVFAYLAEHPDGTRLTDLEEEFGMGRFEMARTIKRLTDYGKVEKRDLLYFAI